MGSIPLNKRITPRSDRDYFPTPPWATRALCDALDARGLIKGHDVWEPACGEGYMALPLGEYFDQVRATDIADCTDAFTEQSEVSDFLLDWPNPDSEPVADWIITNPPFNQALDFFEAAFRRASVGVAFFVKQQFLEGVRRHREIYARRPPAMIFQFAERVPLVKGRIDPDVSTNQSYIWIVWLKGKFGVPEFFWLPPCRSEFERKSDYPAPPEPVDAHLALWSTQND